MECQLTSLESQRTHYTAVIQANPSWELVDIYWEAGVSGTKATTRPELQRLMADCRAGLIDMVVTKSISRFSRNTADCLELVRALTAMGVVLRFEKENIQTNREESELMLAILAALAQDESRSLSQNMKWSIQRRFEAGTYLPPRVPYGYRKYAGSLVIHPQEAVVVRRIFFALANGRGATTIASELNAQKVLTWSQANSRPIAQTKPQINVQTHDRPDATSPKSQNKWRASTVRDMARNRFYTGDALYQKTFTDDQYRRHKNTGQLKQYLHVGNHPAIVDRETFAKVNALLARKQEKTVRMQQPPAVQAAPESIAFPLPTYNGAHQW